MPDPTTAAPNPETAEEVIDNVVSWIEPTLNYLTRTWEFIAWQYLSVDGLLRLAVIASCGAAAYFLTRHGTRNSKPKLA